MKEAVKFAPWAICILVAGLYLGGLRNPPVVSPVAPTPVTPVVVEDTLESILTKSDAMFLSAYVDNLSKYIALDTAMKDNADLEKLVSVSGVVINLGHEPYKGLGKIVATYFDEESEFPQLKGELTPENRAKAIAAWQKFKLDLDKVQK